MTRMIEQFRALAADGALPEHAEHILVAVAEGKSHEEIGQELGVSPGTVAHRLVEIRTRFKKKLMYAGRWPCCSRWRSRWGSRRGPAAASP